MVPDIGGGGGRFRVGPLEWDHGLEWIIAAVGVGVGVSGTPNYTRGVPRPAVRVGLPH